MAFQPNGPSSPLPLAGGAGGGPVLRRRTGPPLTPPASGRGILSLAAFLLVVLPFSPAAARTTVEASAPTDLAVTLYRDPTRGEFEQMNRNWPQGFAMVTETRTVTLPPGESTIRFTGVAEGMVAVSAIVTGLPGGTIEKNRNADLLSPAALVDGTLGNRVTITRTNPATGEATRESAIVRTRADGGLVLQTDDGYEAVRCSGLPEKLTFDRVPAGLSAQPVYSIDTQDPAGGTYTIELTYLAWGFDWQANYVAHVEERGRGNAMTLRLMSWLTLLNDNGQSFPDAELLVVAGTLNVVSDFEDLADPPAARPLRLTCYPLGSTAAGSSVDSYASGPPPPPPPPPPPAPAMARADLAAQESIVVTGARVMKAEEENLGDLKLYRVPERVTVAAKGLKQVAFLDQDQVEGEMVYEAACSPWQSAADPVPAEMRFETVNDRAHGLGVALPMGAVTFYEPSPAGDLFVGEQQLRDHAQGQDVEIALGESVQVFATCERTNEPDGGEIWSVMRATLTNANPVPVVMRLRLGSPAQWTLRGLRGTTTKDGEAVYEFTLPPNSRREVRWDARQVGA